MTAVVIYFQVRHNQLSSKVSNLEEIIRSRDQRIAVLENVVQEILKCQPDSVKKNVSLRVRSVQNSPVRLNTAAPRDSNQGGKVASPPPPPRPNPLQSIMNMKTVSVTAPRVTV